MRKIVFIFMVFISFTMVPVPSLMSAVELPLSVVVDGSKLIFPDAQPFIDENSRTQMPAKFIGEALGAQVIWDSQGRRAIFTLDGKELVFYIGNKDYTVNGQTKQMDTVAITEEGRIFVPVKYIAEALGASVKWDSDIKTVYISTEAENINSTEETEVIAGFIIPLDSPLLAFKPVGDDRVDVTFVVDFLNPDYEKQKIDLENILSQKCDSTTVEKVVAHMRQRKSRWDELPEQYIYDKKTKRYIWIPQSRSSNIDVNYLTEKTSYLYLKNE